MPKLIWCSKSAILQIAVIASQAIICALRVHVCMSGIFEFELLPSKQLFDIYFSKHSIQIVIHTEQIELSGYPSTVELSHWIIYRNAGKLSVWSGTHYRTFMSTFAVRIVSMNNSFWYV